MKKSLLSFIVCVFSICTFANFEHISFTEVVGSQEKAKYVAQCKMNSTSYVVAEQVKGTYKIIARGYGEAANCTVVATVMRGEEYNQHTIVIKDGQGAITLDYFGVLVKVENIVCFDK